MTDWATFRSRPGSLLRPSYTIMAMPTARQCGWGTVRALVPDRDQVVAVRGGDLEWEAYKAAYSATLESRLAVLGPRALLANMPYMAARPVESGATLCCACSPLAASQGRCHRVIAAEFLTRAGWTVALS